ncbi:MAG TPA: 6-carboxytetrahydropterin synthase [Tepidisphaeraceae bacterium]|jgi:6-pyruvoyltetrahydropterin/6-carboxytetrahydropterin synthase
MFRLTREVRFAVNEIADDQLSHPPSNSYAGYPSLSGFGKYFALRVTLQAPLDSRSGYLRNIKEIDWAVREKIIGGSLWPTEIFAKLRGAWPGAELHSIQLFLSPFLSLTELSSEHGMHTRLSQKFEFSASHRLHNPAFSDEQNRATYGKCNNPSGHGHNYEIEVTLRGQPKANGLLVDVPAFERIVQQQVIEKFDHKNLNLDVSEFRELIPSVENITKVIYGMLKNRFSDVGAELASVKVWETPKTFCEYSEM